MYVGSVIVLLLLVITVDFIVRVISRGFFYIAFHMIKIFFKKFLE